MKKKKEKNKEKKTIEDRITYIHTYIHIIYTLPSVYWCTYVCVCVCVRKSVRAYVRVVLVKGVVSPCGETEIGVRMVIQTTFKFLPFLRDNKVSPCWSLVTISTSRAMEGNVGEGGWCEGEGYLKGGKGRGGRDI